MYFVKDKGDIIPTSCAGKIISPLVIKKTKKKTRALISLGKVTKLILSLWVSTHPQ